MFVGKSVNREMFMLMLAEVWPTWVSNESVTKAFKRCGVTDSRLDIDFMQKEKFVAAALVNGSDSDSESDELTDNTNALKVKQPWHGDSPANVKRASHTYWKEKCLSGESNAEAYLKIKGGDWVCSHCSCNNFAAKEQCYRCKKKRQA